MKLIIHKTQITDSKLFVPVVTLSKENDLQLSEQLKSGFKSFHISFQGVNKFFVLPYANDGGHVTKQYREIRKILTGQGDDYTTGCLLYFDYFGKSYRLIAADSVKQKALAANPRAFQQIIFTGKVPNNKISVY